MPSGWGVYYVVFLSAILALGIPAILAMIAFVFSKDERLRKKGYPRVDTESQPATNSKQNLLGQRINARFFLAANAALILIALGLILIPCAGTLQSAAGGASRETSIWGLAATVTIAGFAALGLLYSGKKGDLSWLYSYHEARDLHDEDGKR